MILISSGLVGKDEVFSKARNNRGKTLLLLHQQINPGVSFSLDGRLTLRIQGHRLDTDDIRGHGHFLCFITVKAEWQDIWKYKFQTVFESTKSVIHCQCYSFRLCQIRNFLVSSLGTDMSSREYGLNCLTSKEQYVSSVTRLIILVWITRDYCKSILSF